MSNESGFSRVLLFIIVIAVVVGGFWFVLIKNRQESPTGTSTDEVKSSFNKGLHSLTEPSSLWVIVNKKAGLPEGYEPSSLIAPAASLRTKSGDREMQLRPEAAAATEALLSDAKQAGHDLIIVSAYRSYIAQKDVYNANVREAGQAEADKYSARPGHSEHQTGLAVDFGSVDRSCELETCFADTKAGKWLAENAYKYGFVLRYEKDKQDIVGYNFEPWHFRFVGKELSEEVHKTGQTLEEFFGLPAAPSY